MIIQSAFHSLMYQSLSFFLVGCWILLLKCPVTRIQRLMLIVYFSMTKVYLIRDSPLEIFWRGYLFRRLSTWSILANGCSYYLLKRYEPDGPEKMELFQFSLVRIYYIVLPSGVMSGVAQCQNLIFSGFCYMI